MNFFLPIRLFKMGSKRQNPVSFDWGSKIAPRLGVAWDVLGDGKWKLSSSLGHFYDVLKYPPARGGRWGVSIGSLTSIPS